ncbi:MAG: hypothetical protein Q9187_001117 [Circinaria calcarea]
MAAIVEDRKTEDEYRSRRALLDAPARSRIRDIGFDIALPGTYRSPLKPIISGRPRRTPQPELAPQRSSRRTPKSTPLVPQQSSRRTPSTLHSKRAGRQSPVKLPGVEEQEDSRSNSQPTQRDESGSVTKKRRLATTVSNPEVQRPRKDAAILTPHVQVEGVEKEATAGGAPSEQEGVAIDGSGAEGEDERIVPPRSASSTDQPKKKRKKRKSIVQAGRKRVNIAPPDSPLRLKVTPTQIVTTFSGSAAQPTLNPSDVVDEPVVLPEVQPPEDIRPKSKRKRRKSIVQLSKSRKKSVTAPSIVSTLPHPEKSKVTTDQEELISEFQGQDEEAVQLPAGRLARVDDIEDQVEEESHTAEPERTQGNELPISYEKDVEVGAELKQNKRRGRPRRPSVVSGDLSRRKTTGSKAAPHRTHNAPPLSRNAIKQSGQRRSSESVVGSIPVTVHRLSRVQEIDDEADVLAGPVPFPKKGGVNAVDVLSQVCREIINKTVDTLQQGVDREGNNRSRAEWTRKRKAIEIFGDELDDRLFQMTEALDNNYALKIRTRQANKAMVAAREELLRLRGEREAVALQMDEVRIKHERSSKIAQEKNELDSMLRDIKLAVHRGRAQQESHSRDTKDVKGDVTGLEFSLRNIAQKVSSANGPGLLDRVKDFNSLLEKAIRTLVVYNRVTVGSGIIHVYSELRKDYDTIWRDCSIRQGRNLILIAGFEAPSSRKARFLSGPPEPARASTLMRRPSQRKYLSSTNLDDYNLYSNEASPIPQSTPPALPSGGQTLYTSYQIASSNQPGVASRDNPEKG